MRRDGRGVAPAPGAPVVGGQNKLSVEDQLLVALEYWREYRSQFQLTTS